MKSRNMMLKARELLFQTKIRPCCIQSLIPHIIIIAIGSSEECPKGISNKVDAMSQARKTGEVASDLKFIVV
jgi:hypothetical protein